jgi:hypothetical protein
MAAKAGKQKQAGRCVFCGGHGLSKEHVFSEWLKRVFPATASHSQQTIHATLDLYTGEAFVHPNFKDRQGSFHSRKIRNVCAKCNNGWMSGIVDRAKPIVGPMMSDEAAALSVANQGTWLPGSR